MTSTLEFHFYETVIKAVVYRDKEPNKKQTHYLCFGCVFQFRELDNNAHNSGTLSVLFCVLS